jgi:hypothetical protein
MRREESKNRRTVTTEGCPKHEGNAKPVFEGKAASTAEAKADKPKLEAKRNPSLM